MTGRYRIFWSDAQTIRERAKPFKVFAAVCRSLTADGLDYSVELAPPDSDGWHSLTVSASGTPRKAPQRSTTPRRTMRPLIPYNVATNRRQETEWFLYGKPDMIAAFKRRVFKGWDYKRGRMEELSKMAVAQLQSELEYWQAVELESGRRDHFKPGLTGERREDDECAA